MCDEHKEAQVIAWDAAIPEDSVGMITIVSIATMPIEVGKRMTLESSTHLRNAEGKSIISPAIRLVAENRYAMAEFIHDLLRENLKAYREDQEKPLASASSGQTCTTLKQ